MHLNFFESAGEAGFPDASTLADGLVALGVARSLSPEVIDLNGDTFFPLRLAPVVLAQL
jgi:hypothetical protein